MVPLTRAETEASKSFSLNRPQSQDCLTTSRPNWSPEATCWSQRPLWQFTSEKWRTVDRVMLTPGNASWLWAEVIPPVVWGIIHYPPYPRSGLQAADRTPSPSNWLMRRSVSRTFSRGGGVKGMSGNFSRNSMQALTRTGYLMTSAISQRRCAAAAHFDGTKSCSNRNADGSQQKEAAGHRLEPTLCRVETDWRRVTRGPSRDSHMCECHISVKCPICIRNTSHSS